MSDPVAEMKARARKELDAYDNNQSDTRDMAALLAAFAAKEVAEVQQKLDDCDLAFAHANEVLGKLEADLERATEAERLENAKAICVYCLHDDRYEKAERDTSPYNGWHHRLLGEKYEAAICYAAPIWERAHGKGENNGRD